MEDDMKRTFLYVVIILTRILADLPLYWMFYVLHFPFQKQGSGGIPEAMFNAALFISWGAIHSLLARDFAKKRMAKLVGDNFVRTGYVWIAGITLTLVLLLWRPVSGVLWQADGILYWLLTLLYFGFIAGMIYTTFFIDYLDFVGIRAHLRAMRNRPHRPPVFSVKGPYAYCRHPLYLLLLISFWLTPVMTLTRFEFALIGSVYLVIGTYFEERNLRQELGEVYELYQANVPMWIPRLSPWKYKRRHTFRANKTLTSEG
jgi:protein-S-isoprenylcysteine O-methyltransferase Ste14